MATLVRSMGSETQDGRISSDVRRQIAWQADIQSEEIEIQVKNGMVFLDGRVETRLERLEAENAANAACGVSSVINDIRVVPKRAHSDDEIQRDVNAGLRTVLCVLEKSPAVTVEDGVVMLEGNVRWSFQRSSAERAADAVIGVRSVRNRIQVGRSAPVLPMPDSYPARMNTTSTLLLGRGEARSPMDEQPVLAAAS